MCTTVAPTAVMAADSRRSHTDRVAGRHPGLYFWSSQNVCTEYDERGNSHGNNNRGEPFEKEKRLLALSTQGRTLWKRVHSFTLSQRAKATKREKRGLQRGTREIGDSKSNIIEKNCRRY